MELGADPVTAIQGVTSRAARVCRLEDRIGKLENGMEADIIAVEGNPLEDVSRLSQVRTGDEAEWCIDSLRDGPDIQNVLTAVLDVQY